MSDIALFSPPAVKASDDFSRNHSEDHCRELAYCPLLHELAELAARKRKNEDSLLIPSPRPCGERVRVRGFSSLTKNEDSLKAELQRPYLVVYGPDFCGLCPGMFEKVGGGDERVRVRCIKGDAKTFPSFIQDYGNSHGWPVEHWTSPTGKHALMHGVKSIDQLAELVQTEPGQIPRPTNKDPQTASINHRSKLKEGKQ